MRFNWYRLAVVDHLFWAAVLCFMVDILMTTVEGVGWDWTAVNASRLRP